MLKHQVHKFCHFYQHFTGEQKPSRGRRQSGDTERNLEEERKKEWESETEVGLVREGAKVEVREMDRKRD